MDNIYWGLVVTIVLMAFFSAMWMAFSASNKLQYELAKKELTERSALLARIFASPGMFVSAMLAGYILSMVVFIMLLASLAGRLAPSLPAWMSVTAWRFVLLFVIASFVVAVIGKLLPRLLITLNPLVTLRIFSPLLWCFYKILRPVAVAMSALSAFILRIFGVKHAHGATSKAFSRVDLDNFVKSGIDAAEDDEHVDEEVKIFSNALDFEKALQIHDYCRGKIRCSFGIGTNLTNDTGFKPSNIVMKLAACRMNVNQEWKECVKLSDDLGKHMGSDREMEACLYELNLTSKMS